MKIAIDVSQIVYGTGVSNYTYQLVKNLLKIDENNEYVLFSGALRSTKIIYNKIKNLNGNFEHVRTVISPSIGDVLWNRLHIFPIEKFVGDVDIVHTSDWLEPPSNNAKKVTTVHDLTPILYPEETDSKIVSVHKRKLDWVKKESDRIIAPTIATKNDLVKLGFSNNKIVVIYEGVDEMFKPSNLEKINCVKKKYGVRGSYFLAVGTKKRKNTERMVRGFVESKDAIGVENFVVAGEEREGNRNGVIHTGFIDNSDLVALYSGAEALVYASTYEGFGLPILEAFACNCPVLTSNVSCMPEIAGKAAVLVDPMSIESIQNGMKTVVKSKTKLISLGKQRVKMFSWRKTAKDTLKLYNFLK